MTNLWRDLGFYFSRKIGYPLVAPDVLQLSVTNRCNLRCKSCNVWRQSDSPEKELSLDEMRMIIDESARWGIREVHLLGGEPLLNENWEEVVRYAKINKMTAVICSNGTLIDKDSADRIVKSKVDLLCISLDGAKSQTHDFLRGENGAYEKIIKGINTLNEFNKEIRPKVVLILTVSRKNLFELKDYIDLAHSLHTCGIYFTALVLDNVNLFSQKKTHDLWIEDKYFKELDAIFEEIYEYSKSKGYYLDYPSFKLFPKYFKGNLSQGQWVCFAGLKRLAVTATGDIQLCGDIIGSYRKAKSLRQVWSSYPAFKRRIFVKRCSNYCLQDCHARPESNYFLEIIKRELKQK